jgi:DNA-directed RNA polymerase subunit RPC12/RpoP
MPLSGVGTLITRNLPGRPTQFDFLGRVKHFKAVVLYVSEYSIAYMPEGKILGLQRLIGQTYIYQCTFCTSLIEGKRQPTTVFEMERVKSKGACPHCSHQLEFLKAGQTLRIHFRTNIPKNKEVNLMDHRGYSSEWWAERYDF